MSRTVLSRLVCGLLVTILSALPLAAAESAGPAEPRASVLASLWSWLAELWGDAGCYRCDGSTSSTPSEPAQNENGCYIDPHGGCHGEVSSAPSEPAHLEEGCYIDPYGGCRG